MAIFRKIQTSFWSDTFIQDLDNEQRLFYLYLLTNEKTKQCGIYEISKKQITFNLGISSEKVTELIEYFINAGKIRYSLETNEIAIKNWMKYNGSTSPKVVSCINSELKQVKDRVLIEYVNGMYTASQEEQEQEEEQEEDTTFDYVWNLYGKVGNRKTSLEKWTKFKLEERKQIETHIPLYVKNHSENDKLSFLPHLTTYLTQRRWLDELPYKQHTKPFTLRNQANLNDD